MQQLIDSTTLNNSPNLGLNNATRYYFRVTAVNKQGFEGTASAIDITPTFSGPVWFVSKQGNDNMEKAVKAVLLQALLTQSSKSMKVIRSLSNKEPIRMKKLKFMEIRLTLY